MPFRRTRRVPSVRNVSWSQVPRCGHLLWLLDDVPSETEAGGNRGMIFWSKGLIFLFIFSGSLRPLQGQRDFNSPDILKCCEMLMGTIFTWVATTSDTRVHARHTHTPTRTLGLCPLTLDRYSVQISVWNHIMSAVFLLTQNTSR